MSDSTPLDAVPNPVEEVTPNPEEAVTPDPPKEPSPAEEPKKNLESIVDHLAERIEDLTKQVAAIVPSPGTEAEPPGEPADENPVKKPWTHRGFFGN